MDKTGRVSTATRPRHAAHRASPREAWWWLPFLALLGVATLVAGSLAALGLEHHHGVTTVGDEVHYLIGAIALGRFGTLQVSSATHWAVAHQLFPHMTSNELLRHVLPTGYQVHAPGIPLLLALPVLGGVTVARVSWIVVLAIGIVVVSIIAARSLGRRTAWPMALVALIATPATFLAMTQIYPDLPAGAIIAALWLVIWRLETGWQPPGWALVSAGVSVGALVLLHSKNLVPAALLTAALVVVAVKRGVARRTLPLFAAGILPLAIVWLVTSLIAFHPGVLPRSGLGGLDVRSLTGILGLLVDAQQGLLVQQPWVVLGVAGIIVMARRAPWSTAALVGSLVIVLGANGSLMNTYGGTSMVGRFGWELLVPLAAGGALFLVKLREHRRGAAIVVLGAALALALIQGIVLVTLSHHAFFNHVVLPGHWQQGRAYGWWPGASFLPVLDAMHLRGAWQHAATWWSVGLVLSVAVAAIAGLLWLLEPRRWPRLTSLAAVGVAVVCIVGRALS